LLSNLIEYAESQEFIQRLAQANKTNSGFSFEIRLFLLYSIFFTFQNTLLISDP